MTTALECRKIVDRFFMVFGILRASPSLYLRVRAVRSFSVRLAHRLRSVHSTFYMGVGCKVSRDLIAGAYSYVGPGCQICPRVELGRYVMFGPGVVVTGSDHRYDVPGVPMIFSGRPKLLSTVIGDDVWVGQGALIMAGVTIGRGSIIAAHAVVTRDVPPFEIHGGIPAKKISDRFTDLSDRSRHEQMLMGATVVGEFCEPLAGEE